MDTEVDAEADAEAEALDAIAAAVAASIAAVNSSEVAPVDEAVELDEESWSPDAARASCARALASAWRLRRSKSTTATSARA